MVGRFPQSSPVTAPMFLPSLHGQLRLPERRASQFTATGTFSDSSTQDVKCVCRLDQLWKAPLDTPADCFGDHAGVVASRKLPSFAVARNCGIGSSSLNADVNAFDRLHMVRGWNSSCCGLK